MKSLRQDWPLNIIAALTALLGIATLSSTLYELVHLHYARIIIADAHLTLIAGISLIYLGMLLRRGKHNAWLAALAVFPLILIRNTRHFVFDDEMSGHYLLLVLTNLVLPILLLICLVIFRQRYVVRSEATTFRIALRRAIIILLIAFLYGVIGFQLFDRRDFHEEIGPSTAAHYTIDQIGLTTNNKPTPHTRRSLFFVDSLATVSVVSLAYVAFSLFSPIRFRLAHRQQDYIDAKNIVGCRPKTSEDFFKLWPRDKVYFFNQSRTSMLAYRVSRGVALVVGDPLGTPAEVKQLLISFDELCRANDWRTALVHTDKSNLKLYKRLGLEAQKIGEEALVDVANFNSSVVRNKYFRNINNRFSKGGYTFEVLEPPHDQATLDRLAVVSDSWLSSPGRAERGFMLGYFSAAYMQQCRIAVVKDQSGNIQAFLNQVPDVLNKEANYDFLRHESGSLSNINDFLMLNFIKYLGIEGYSHLNMGLCPLSGLDKENDADKNLLGSILRFAYANGGRFYSFEGLKRFKSKYEPNWEDRYIVYGGGIAGFGRVLSALLKAMTNIA
ncbi:MAG TPA: phosphatidylglycerol lysyltransferase domain-containing protein [Candidatus Saccharimonadales bacterium]|nr:phosphatidylglycerol lysyltransferase domain-containing protein [Candidatus Saccharimonadales bacterium]